jgi:hypothetical protein
MPMYSHGTVSVWSDENGKRGKCLGSFEYRVTYECDESGGTGA